MKSLSKGPFLKNLAKLFDAAAQHCADACPDYQIGYPGSAVKENKLLFVQCTRKKFRVLLCCRRKFEFFPECECTAMRTYLLFWGA